MATTFTSTPGYFDWLAKKPTMLDEEYASTVDIDDISAIWRTTKYLMSTKGQSKTTASPIFRTWEGTLSERVYTLNEAITTTELTWTLDSTDGLRVGDIIQAQQSTSAQGIFFRVATLTSTTVIVVTIEDGTAAPIANNEEIRMVGNSVSQSATTAVQATFIVPDDIINRTQIVQRASEWNRTELATRLRAESALQQKLIQGRAEFEKDLDSVVLSSRIIVDSTNTFQTSKGIIPQILSTSGATKVDAGGDLLTYEDFSEALTTGMQFFTTKNLIGIMGTTAFRGMAELGTSSATYRTSGDDKFYGYEGDAVKVGQLSVGLNYERMMTELGGEYNNYIVIISPPDISVRHAEGLKFKHLRNYQIRPDSQIINALWESHIGVSMHHVKRHALIHNLGTT